MNPKKTPTGSKKPEPQMEWDVTETEKGMLQSIEDTISGHYKQVGVLETQKAQIISVIQTHLKESMGILNQMRYKYGIPPNVPLDYNAKEGKLRRK